MSIKAKTIRKSNIWGIKRKRLIHETKDKILNLKRGAVNGGDRCVVCGNEILKHQPVTIPRQSRGLYDCWPLKGA